MQGTGFIVMSYHLFSVFSAMPSTTPRALRLQQRETAQEVRQLLVPESREDSDTEAM